MATKDFFSCLDLRVITFVSGSIITFVSGSISLIFPEALALTLLQNVS
jgi:hypothetical protein